MYRIIWQVLLQTRTEAKAKQLLDKIAVLTEEDISVLESGTYWKDAKLWRVLFHTPIHADNNDYKEIVFSTLIQVYTIAYHWSILFEEYPLLAFSGVANNFFRLSGIEWMSFDMCKADTITSREFVADSSIQNNHTINEKGC